jgi:DNA-binding LacI/PurR family transcriptional regulator
VSWTSALAGGGNVTPADIVDFHRQYRSLPIVSLAQSIERDPLVSIDDYQGMYTLVSHLVDVHGYRRIALICGPEGHLYAHQRYQAFVDALKEKGLSPNPDLITPMMSWEKGAEAIARLLV